VSAESLRPLFTFAKRSYGGGSHSYYHLNGLQLYCNYINKFERQAIQVEIFGKGDGLFRLANLYLALRGAQQQDRDIFNSP
jgi:hypothetical protein